MEREGYRVGGRGGLQGWRNQGAEVGQGRTLQVQKDAGGRDTRVTEVGGRIEETERYESR